MNVLIKNGTLIDPKNNIKEKLDIVLEDKRVKQIAKKIKEVDENGERIFKHVIDAKGMIVAPGFVDVYPNFCDPGVTTKEDLKTGSLASVKGGFTYVVLGVDNVPSTGEVNVIEYIRKYASIMPVNIYTTASLKYGRQLDDISDLNFLSTHGALSFYDGVKPIEDKVFLKNTLIKIKKLNKVFGLYCEDQKKVKINGILKSDISEKLGLKGATPREAEVNDLKVNLPIVKEVGTKVIFTNITSDESLEYFEKEKIESTFAAAPVLNIILNEKALSTGDTNAKLLPPLRSEEERKALINAIRKDVIDIIYSNHTPQLKEDKDVKIKDAIHGSISLETVLGIVGKVLVEDEGMSWSKVIEKISLRPAQIFELDKYGAGEIKVGNIANITIFDPNEEWEITEDTIVSKSKNTPIIGMKLKAKVKYTITNGLLVYRDTNISNLDESLIEKKEEVIEEDLKQGEKEKEKSQRVKMKLFREVFGGIKKESEEEE